MTFEQNNNKVDRVAAETSDIKPSIGLDRELKELQSRLNIVKRVEFLSKIYDYLLSLDVKDDPIQWRILCVLFSRFNTYCLHCINKECDIDRIISTLIQPSVFSRQEVRQNLREWIKKGQRYQLLSIDLGGLGNLLVLPEDHGESFWTKAVPKEGPRRKKLIQSLLRRGIHRQACGIDAHNTATSILSGYLEQMIHSFSEMLDLSQWKGEFTLNYNPQLFQEIPSK